MSETIAYIIKEARGVLDELLKHGYKVVWSLRQQKNLAATVQNDW